MNGVFVAPHEDPPQPGAAEADDRHADQDRRQQAPHADERPSGEPYADVEADHDEDDVLEQPDGREAGHGAAERRDQGDQHRADQQRRGHRSRLADPGADDGDDGESEQASELIRPGDDMKEVGERSGSGAAARSRVAGCRRGGGGHPVGGKWGGGGDEADAQVLGEGDEPHIGVQLIGTGDDRGRTAGHHAEDGSGPASMRPRRARNQAAETLSAMVAAVTTVSGSATGAAETRAEGVR